MRQQCKCCFSSQKHKKGYKMTLHYINFVHDFPYYLEISAMDTQQGNTQIN